MVEKPKRRLRALLTVTDVAAILNVKCSTVYAQVKAGKIPHVKLWSGKRKALIRFEPDAIERMIREAKR